MPFERFEVEPSSSMGDVFDAICDTLEDQGYDQIQNDDPEVTIVIKTNFNDLQTGLKLSTGILYIGATTQEVAADLTTRI